MGTTALRQLLKSVCSTSPWKYAVLWKLRLGTPPILTWEDGYCEYPKPRQTVESISEELYCSHASGKSTSQHETSNGSYPVGLVVADLSRIQYILGEGAVGQVASTGSHCWVSFDDIFANEVQQNLVPDCPEEWLLQFASGFKTILLVPLLPHGVLQLGSLEEVAENIEIVASLRSRFNAFHNVGGNTIPVTLKKYAEPASSSLPMSSSMNYASAPSAITINTVKSEYLEDPMPVNSFKLNGDNTSSVNQVFPLFTEENMLSPSEKDSPETFKFEEENKLGTLPTSFTEESTPIESLNSCEVELFESKMLELSCLMQELESFSECTNYNAEVFGESVNAIVNSCPARDMAELLCGGKDAQDAGHKDISSFLNFPKDSELHKALGPAFQERSNEEMWDLSSFIGNSYRSQRVICNKDVFDKGGPSWFASGDTEKDLLEAVVVNGYNGSVDIPKSCNFKLSPTSFKNMGTASQLQKQSETSSLAGNDSALWSDITSELTTGDKHTSLSSSTLKSMIMNATLDKEQHRGGNNRTLAQKGQKMSNASKRRVKSGDNQRPRPRDRQLIQDRVKELRELVPDGTKCSIDGLLDRTIKHLMYLRSVTEQADKLKQWGLQEVASYKSRRSSELKRNYQQGTSWAYEFGSESQICPIVVEDLAYPGHMLIEMLCNEHGLFLEIAQMIRGLELTILTGVMEGRANETWAHFIVEASKGFHRLDIFWPLMQLLQRKRKTISSKI